MFKKFFFRLSVSVFFLFTSISLSLAAESVDYTEERHLSKNNNEVSIYIASWCAHCNKVKDYLDNLNVPYIAYDIDTPTGQEKFESLKAQGIPIIVVGDLQIDGFNASQLEKVLCEHTLLND